ncbi:hypothetical protein [Luteolibacter marinus]|uniref:hypothetical protein n=1 Tax=Luteolibacter marinus TaxID=2776705 RepID=UPI001866F473|nr:hypothetical protein [Luteolibacter marinus]
MLFVAAVVPSLAQEAVEEDIRGPKPLIEIAPPEPATPWLAYGLWSLLGLAVAGVLLWWWLRRKPAVVSAEDKARLELEALGRDGGSMEAGDFAAAASQVVRVFIERRFGLAAPRRTTEEFLSELAAGGNLALSARMDPLRGFLKACDMAKFAAADLDIGRRGELVAKARAFVDVPVEPETEVAK